MPQFTKIDESNFSGGIDARNSENQIPEGYVQDLLNGDVVENRVKQRTGYQGYAGNIPVRVQSVQLINGTDMMCLTLDTSIDLLSSTPGPITVIGRSSSITNNGPFSSSEISKWYPTFEVELRKQMIIGTSSISIPNSEHALNTSNYLASFVESTSTFDTSYQTADVEDITINTSTYELVGDYTNTVSIKNVIAYYLDRNDNTGFTKNVSLGSIPSGGSTTVTINAATHGLSNYNIVPQILETVGGTRRIVYPDTLEIDSAGTVSVSITNNTGASATYSIILTVPESLSQGLLSSIGPSTTTSLTIPVDSPWVFPAVYQEVSGTREWVRPDFISYSASSGELTITFTNNDAVAKNVQVYYIYGFTRSNQLCVSDSTISANAIDTRPQLTIWGLDHSSIYSSNAGPYAGWANHIDSYRSTGEQKLVTGLGGNLFTATSTPSLRLYPDLRNRVGGSQTLAPLFWDTGDTPGRTRGYVTGNNLGSNWATVTAATYDSGNGWTRYTISIPNMQILDSTGTPTILSSVISAGGSTPDYLTVDQMGYSRLEGKWKIMQVSNPSTGILYIWVDNTNVNSPDWDDNNAGGWAGVFSDQLQFSNNSTFLPGDVLNNASIGTTIICTVLSSNGTVVVVDGVVAVLPVAAGVVTVGTRNSNCIPSRTAQPTSTSSVSGFVPGDMISYSGIERQLRILSVHSDQDRSVSITSDGETAIATLASGSTLGLSVGQSLVLVNAGEYNGTIIVSSITSETVFQFSSTNTSPGTGTLLGYTIELDESFSWGDTVDDSVSLLVPQRWYPIEAPDDSFSQTPSTYISHFESNSYDRNLPIRSTMISNNLYLTNGQDEVMKYDGANLYRAGLPSWQPGLFITQDTSATGKVVINRVSTPVTSDSTGTSVLHVGAGLHTQFPIGSYVTANSISYRVIGHDSSSTEGKILVDRNVPSNLFSPTVFDVKLLSSFRYYFRLNAIDANNNIITSCISGSQDHVVLLGDNAAINIKLVGLPVWDVYDYDRLEVEIYRSLSNTSTPFYRIATIPMQFDSGTGYINYSDSFSDINLNDLDVTSGVQGSFLGVGWNEPLRGKYICGIGNTLVLGNVRDVPKLDIELSAPRTLSYSDLSGKLITLRRTGTGTVSDMVNTAVYEFVTSGALSGYTVSGVLNTSFTITVSNSCTPGSWIYLYWDSIATSGRPLTYAGWWQVASATSTTIVVNSSQVASGAITSLVPNRLIMATNNLNIPVFLGTDGNMGMFNGDPANTFPVFDSMRRLSMAINASMRMVDTSVVSGFTPWIIARGGNDAARAGRVVVSQPRTDSGTLSVLLPTISSTNIFVNGQLSTGSVNASTRVFPSRIIVSYESYPEVYNNPATLDARDSISVIDVNSADGQAITGIIPFFGESAFTAAQQSGILVVFKENSIYLVDINEKRKGGAAVQRIESEGLGCTAPYSIAVTKGGVVFANESGIYCLRQNQTISYIGRFMERNWQSGVNLSRLDLVQGHHYGSGRAYKVSIPVTSASSNSLVFTYNHTNEESGKLGAWSRYDNHPATGWANLASNAYFSSTTGRVFSLRNTGLVQDYRDDNAAINFQLTTRALDFGNALLRKILDKAYISYRSLVTTTGLIVSFSRDLSSSFLEGTHPTILRNDSSTGLDDTPQKAVTQIGQANPDRRGTYFQLRVENSTIDENVEVVGVVLNIAGLTERGKLQAGQSTKYYTASKNRSS